MIVELKCTFSAYNAIRCDIFYIAGYSIGLVKVAGTKNRCMIELKYAFPAYN